MSGWRLETVTDPVTKQLSQQWNFDRMKDGFVRSYAATNPAEDFAETAAYFRFSPDLAMSKSPVKSAYLSKRIFDNRVFTDAGVAQYYSDFAYKDVMGKMSQIISSCLIKNIPDSGINPSVAPNVAPGLAPAADESEQEGDLQSSSEKGRGGADAGPRRMPAATPNKNSGVKTQTSKKTVTPTSTPRQEPRSASRLMLTARVTPEAATCIETAIDSAMTMAFNDLRSNEYESCRYFQSSEGELRTKLFGLFGPQVSRMIVDETALVEANKKLSLFKQRIGKKIDPREVFLHTFRLPNPEAAYSATLAGAFDQVSAPFAADLGDILSGERARFLEENGFQKVSSVVASFFNQVFGGAKPLARGEAEQRWRQCMQAAPLAGDAPSASANVLTTPFSGGARFISASILNCVNQGALRDVEAIMTRYAADINYQLNDPDAQAYVQSFLLSEYLGALKALADAASDEEAQIRKVRKPRVIEVLTSMLLSDRSWIDSAEGDYGTDSVSRRCEATGARALGDYVSRLSYDQQIPARFDTIENFQASWSKEACAGAMKSAEVIQMIQYGRAGGSSLGANGDSSEKIKTQDLQKLEAILVSLAQAKIKECESGGLQSWSFFKGGMISRTIVSKCLTDDWAPLEPRALTEWLNTPDGAKFSKQRPRLSRYLETRRPVLQDYVLTQGGLKETLF